MASASIDVGSNSLVFLVMNEQRNVMHDETLVVSLGRGLGDGGTFLKDRMEAAMEAFKCFAKTAASFDISQPLSHCLVFGTLPVGPGSGPGL